MRVLDLYCGAGGASTGYWQAFLTRWPQAHITGVDWRKQRHYPFDFIHADARTFPLDGFDIIHASPPCEGHSALRNYEHANRALLVETINRLDQCNAALWVVENVEGVQWPYTETFKLCGSSLGCTINGKRVFMARHRRFWSNLQLKPPPCRCRWLRRNGWQCHGVYGTIGGNAPHFNGTKASKEDAKQLMGIDWMPRESLVQAVPPAYTRLIANEAIRLGVFD